MNIKANLPHALHSLRICLFYIYKLCICQYITVDLLTSPSEIADLFPISFSCPYMIHAQSLNNDRVVYLYCLAPYGPRRDKASIRLSGWFEKTSAWLMGQKCNISFLVFFFFVDKSNITLIWSLNKGNIAILDFFRIYIHWTVCQLLQVTRPHGAINVDTS